MQRNPSSKSICIVLKNMIKFGLCAIYAKFRENREQRATFMDWCQNATDNILREILPGRAREEFPPNLMFLAFDPDRKDTPERKWFSGPGWQNQSLNYCYAKNDVKSPKSRTNKKLLNDNYNIIFGHIKFLDIILV